MKKRNLLVLLPLFALVSCAQTDVLEAAYLISNRDGLPTIAKSATAEHSTYLMMSRYGYLSIGGEDIYPGVIADKFIENVIEWKTEAGGDLPSVSSVHSTVSGVTFRGWAQYNGNVYPDYLDKVPSVSGQFVYAIFDGPTGGGGSGGGGEETVINFTVTDMPTWVKDDGCVIFAWAWGATDNGSWKALTYTSDTSATFDAPNDTTGFLLARCKEGTVTPDWNIHTDVAGRIYNQTEDISVTSGTTSYACSSWKEYH